VNDTCICADEWTGEDCSQNIVQIESGKYVAASVGPHAWKYFRIWAIIENTLRIIVNQTSATGDVDMYVRYNKPPTLSVFDQVDQTLAKNFYADIQLDRFHFGWWIVGIYGLSQCSFQIKFEQYSECPNLCSMHGTCVPRGCNCEAGFEGAFCESMSNDLADGQVIKGFVADNTWNYYTFTPRSTTDLLIWVNQTVAGADQDCDLYARLGAKPTETEFDARNLTGDPDNTLRISDGQFSKWYIGVYGFRMCTYLVSASSTDQCPRCEHGTCSSEEGICICHDGWAGEYCNIQVFPVVNYSAPISGSLKTGKWAYYSVQGTPGAYLSVHLLEKETEGYFWLFLNPKSPPTLSNYNRTLSDKESNSAHHELHTEVTYPDKYYVGVYGSPFSANDDTAYPYTLQVWESPFRRR